jgi:hypothetical protein
MYLFLLKNFFPAVQVPEQIWKNERHYFENVRVKILALGARTRRKSKSETNLLDPQQYLLTQQEKW